MNTLDYVTAIAELNQYYLQPGSMPECSVFNAYAWGLLEETSEFSKVKSKDEALLEAGDVLAYTALLLLCVSPIEFVTNELEFIPPSYYQTFDVLEFLSNMKRINREGETFDTKQVIALWFDVLTAAYKVHSLTFEQIADANISKLKNRQTRDMLFKGRGDKR